jgi:WD40 repeat protein
MKNKIIRKIENKEHWKWLIEFNGTILAISSIESINFWDVSKGKLLKSISNEYYTHPSFSFRFLDKGGFVTAHKNMIKLWI